MRKFLLKISVFILVALGFFFWLSSRVDGYSDPFYKRFTTPRQQHLILGSSRPAQGIHPQVLDSILNKSFFNHSFSILHSPFGPAYLNNIKRKFDTNTQDGVFIIAVDPWSLASFTKDPEDSLSFREYNSSVMNTRITNLNPNPFYLLRNWNKEYFRVFSKKDSVMFLHEDGWLEVSIEMDSASVTNRIERKEKMYRADILPKSHFSQTRLEYLKKTIAFLKDHGEVYLTRLPVHPKIMEIENELLPDFDQEILAAIEVSTGYLDLTDHNNKFLYTDGNHLDKESGRKVSEIIGLWIASEIIELDSAN